MSDGANARGEALSPPTVTPRRSLAKALSWRVVGSLDTLLLSWLVITFLGPLLGRASESGSDNLRVAGYIALSEVATKLVLFFVHERVWARVRWGEEMTDGGRRESHARTGVKTATWRTTASLDTFLLALLFTRNIGTAFSIGTLEVFTKLFLYYLHERVWLRISFGLDHGDASPRPEPSNA